MGNLYFFQNISLEELFLASLIPLIAALIGWFTNYIAIKMLFYPRAEKLFLGIRFHGVFPKRQAHLAKKLGELFADRLGVQKSIEREISGLVNFDQYRDVLKSKIQEGALEYISTEMPFLVAMLPKDLVDSLSSKISIRLIEEIRNRFEDSVGTFSSKVDINHIVEKEVNSLDVEELEKLLQDLLKKEFRFIEVSGAVLGFLIGCVQLVLSKYL